MTVKKTSFELFLGLWNAAQNMTTPPVHTRIIRWLAQQARTRKQRLLLMAFRGCGKSTLVGLFCTWLLCHNPDLRILIVAADEALAENMLRHIRHILETHPLAKTLLPAKKQLWSADRLLIERTLIGRDPSLRASGLHSNMTGARADIIICDDVEVPNTSDTKIKRNNLRAALHELDFILTPGGMILYIGTPHTEESIYKKDGFLAPYTRLEIPLTNDVWPDRFTPAVIEDIKQAAGHHVFASQMQLQPMSLKEARLDPAMIDIYDHDLKAQNAFCYWDPAFGHMRGDNSVIAYVVFDDKNHAYVHDLEYLTLNPHNPDDAASQQCAQVINFAQRHSIRNIMLEGNGIGQFLPGLLRQKLKAAHYPCGVQVKHTTTNKNQRILQAFETRLAARALSIHARVAKTDFTAEMTAWQPDTPHNSDDALDAVAGALLQYTPRFSVQHQYMLQPNE